MLKINDKNVDCISKKEIKVIKSIVNKNEGFGIRINVIFTINNINGYFTLNFAHENNNDINKFINKTYKGNWYSDNGDILLEIFDTNNFVDFIDSEVKLEFGDIDNNQIKMILSINDKLIKLEYVNILFNNCIIIDHLHKRIFIFRSNITNFIIIKNYRIIS